MSAHRNAGELPVVHIDQQDDYSCVPICLKMVLDYVPGEFGIELPNLSLDEIRRAIDTRSDGTLLPDVPKINRKLAGGSHLVEFLPSEGNSFDDIRQELTARRPVIAWVERGPPGREFWHSIVLTYVDPRKLIVKYDDPINGKQEQPVSDFLRQWGKIANVLIRVRIDKKPPQTELEQFGSATH